MLKVILILSVLSSILLTVRLETGYCPKVKLMRNFKPERYVGKWYEIKRYPMFFEDENKCVTAEYTLNPDGTIGVLNSAILESVDLPISIKGKAIPNPQNPANLTVEFEKIPAKGKYWVLDTDYVTYSLVYSCSQSPDEPIRVEFSWILSRKPQLSRRRVKSLIKKLVAINSTTTNFETTDQKNCDLDV
jgi:apolipoprotein D and lipocalin family protein